MPQVDYYLAKMPLLSREECGDTAVIKEFDNKIFAAVVDVLGHGKNAHQLTLVIEKFLDDNYREDLRTIILELHRRIMGSVGTVAALCLLDIDSGQLKYTGIGNISIKVFGSVNKSFLSGEGIIGYTMASPKEEMITLANNDILMVFSDGITTRFGLLDYPEMFEQSAKEVATGVINKFGKGVDDAICFVLRYRK